MLLAVGSSAALAAQGRLTRELAAAAIQDGNLAYQAGQPHRALQAYARAVRGGWESADLYLNLGNAAYRAGEIGWAIYFFERGRLLAPGDPDLRANLALALQETKDRLPEIGTSRFLSGLVSLQEATTISGALGWLSFAWWLLALWGAARLAFGPDTGLSRGWARASRWGGLAVAGVFLIALGGVLLKAAQYWTSPSAVVVDRELAVRSNPEAEATVEFTLHAGTRVRLGRSAGSYREVLFSDRLQGWGPASALADLDPGQPPRLPPSVDDGEP